MKTKWLTIKVFIGSLVFSPTLKLKKICLNHVLLEQNVQVYTISFVHEGLVWTQGQLSILNFAYITTTNQQTNKTLKPFWTTLTKQQNKSSVLLFRRSATTSVSTPRFQTGSDAVKKKSKGSLKTWKEQLSSAKQSEANSSPTSLNKQFQSNYCVSLPILCF